MPVRRLPGARERSVPSPLRAMPQMKIVREIFGRRDYAIIGELVQPGTRVLDLGCGEGELLAWLKENKNVDGRGVELTGARVQKAIARGVSVYQGDLESAVGDYPDQVFDYVVLSQTLQETRDPRGVLRAMLRVGRHAIVAFPNFGHYSVRLAHLFSGQSPRNKLFPYDWYDSPNIHFLTIRDFELLAARERWHVERRIFIAGQRQVNSLPNLLAEIGVFLVSATSQP